mmetsp:Transcript_121196/g.348210  ORF Transcript_121196/g.348210 Transcript_121196/m.348210 type:complete len:237 (+) Transcript_121196:404-1114(+)
MPRHSHENTRVFHNLCELSQFLQGNLQNVVPGTLQVPVARHCLHELDEHQERAVQSDGQILARVVQKSRQERQNEGGFPQAVVKEVPDQELPVVSTEPRPLLLHAMEVLSLRAREASEPRDGQILFGGRSAHATKRRMSRQRSRDIRSAGACEATKSSCRSLSSHMMLIIAVIDLFRSACMFMASYMPSGPISTKAWGNAETKPSCSTSLPVTKSSKISGILSISAIPLSIVCKTA